MTNDTLITTHNTVEKQKTAKGQFNMIKNTILFLIFLFLLFLLNVNGRYWIKRFDSFSAGQIYGTMIYEKKSGDFFCFDGYFSVFDITGKVDYFGDFEIDTGKSFQPYDAIRLADGTFVAFGTYWNNNLGPQGYYILKITRDAQVLFCKEFRDNLSGYWWDRTELLFHDGKIKVLYKYDDQNENNSLRISTLAEDGTLLGSKILDLEVDNFWVSASHVSSLKVDPDSYGVILTGRTEINNVWYEGILFLILNKKDEVIDSKWYYFKDGQNSDGYYNHKTKKDSDGGYSVLMGKNNTDTIGFIKTDGERQLKWSREYKLVLDSDETVSPVNFFEDSTGYTIGCTIDDPVQDRYFSPVILKIDNNGNSMWAKKYYNDGFQYEWLTDIIKLVDESTALASNHFYILDKNGEVPGKCEIPVQIAVESKEMIVHEANPGTKNFKISNLDLSLEDVNIRFNMHNTSGADTLCEYLTMEGEITFIEERSIFMGYLIHRIDFSIDPKIAPYISKFKILRRAVPGENYLYISEIPKEEGKASYEIEFKPLYTRSCWYLIQAVNPEDEIVDMVYLTE